MSDWMFNTTSCRSPIYPKSRKWLKPGMRVVNLRSRIVGYVDGDERHPDPDRLAPSKPKHVRVRYRSDRTGKMITVHWLITNLRIKWNDEW